MQPLDTRAEKILAHGFNNPNIPGGLSRDCFKSNFESSKTYGLFTSCFDAEFYRYAATFYDTHVFGRTRPMYAIIGIAKVLEDLQISQRNYPKYRDMKRFIEQDFCPIHDDDNAAQILKKFSRYFTARIDIKFNTDKSNFQILSVSDEDAKVSIPELYQKNGIGYVIQSYAGELKIVAKVSVPGQIRLGLLGLDVRQPDDKKKRVPYWIDYTKLTVNGKMIFDTLTPVWHNKPYRQTMDVEANEEITIEVEWLPHRSDT